MWQECRWDKYTTGCIPIGCTPFSCPDGHKKTAPSIPGTVLLRAEMKRRPKKTGRSDAHGLLGIFIAGQKCRSILQQKSKLVLAALGGDG